MRDLHVNANCNFFASRIFPERQLSSPFFPTGHHFRIRKSGLMAKREEFYRSMKSSSCSAMTGPAGSGPFAKPFTTSTVLAWDTSAWQGQRIVSPSSLPPDHRAPVGARGSDRGEGWAGVHDRDLLPVRFPSLYLRPFQVFYQGDLWYRHQILMLKMMWGIVSRYLRTMHLTSSGYAYKQHPMPAHQPGNSLLRVPPVRFWWLTDDHW